jgi:hypothetical protein
MPWPALLITAAGVLSLALLLARWWDGPIRRRISAEFATLKTTETERSAVMMHSNQAPSRVASEIRSWRRRLSGGAVQAKNRALRTNPLSSVAANAETQIRTHALMSIKPHFIAGDAVGSKLLHTPRVRVWLLRAGQAFAPVFRRSGAVRLCSRGMSSIRCRILHPRQMRRQRARIAAALPRRSADFPGLSCHAPPRHRLRPASSRPSKIWSFASDAAFRPKQCP